MADQESNDLESYIKDDASNESEDASSLLDQSSDLNESDSSSDLLGEDNETSSSSLADDIEEANASILTADPDPFNKHNFEKLTSTLSSIETKIDNETEQLKKLDVLDDIKTEIQKMNENSLMQSTNSSPSVGHNLPGTSELLSRVEELESKIQNNSGGSVSDEIQESINDLLNNVQKLNAATNTYNKRFEKIEETVSRFEEWKKIFNLNILMMKKKLTPQPKAYQAKIKKDKIFYI